MSDTNLSSFIWSVADLLRGDYKQSEYGKVNVVLGPRASARPAGARCQPARHRKRAAWSREALTAQIKQRPRAQGTAVTNFATTLPEIHANLAAAAERSLPFRLPDPGRAFHERELKLAFDPPAVIESPTQGFY